MFALLAAARGFVTTPLPANADGCMDVSNATTFTAVAGYYLSHTDLIVTTCADVRDFGLCTHSAAKEMCCATCREDEEAAEISHDRVQRMGKGGGRRRNSGNSGDTCGHDHECRTGKCADWGHADLRCCPERNNVRFGCSDANRWDQCGNLPMNARCKNHDGSQCRSGACDQPWMGWASFRPNGFSGGHCVRTDLPERSSPCPTAAHVQVG